jgi:hypothetical protein
MLAGIVFLAAKARSQPKGDLPWLAFLALMVVLGVAIAVGYYLKREAQEEPTTDGDLLAEFEAARDAGEMDEEEFRRVTASLRKKMGRPPLESPAQAPAPPMPPAPDEAAPRDQSPEQPGGGDRPS